MIHRHKIAVAAGLILLLAALATAIVLILSGRSETAGPTDKATSKPSTTAESLPTTELAARGHGPPSRVHAMPYRDGDSWGSLRVHVIWADDKKPVAGIVCRVVPNAEANPEIHARKLLTDADGTVFVERVRAGTVDLQLGSGGSATARVRAAEETETTVELDPGCAVEGIVVDPAGAAVPGAGVYVGFRGGWMYAPGGVFEDPPAARTAADGTFRLRVIDDPQLIGDLVVARAAGYAPSLCHRIAAHRRASVRLRLVLGGLGGQLLGRVLDPVGHGIPGAVVVVDREEVRALRLADGTAVQDWNAFRATTDLEGRFHIVGLPARKIQVDARAPGFQPWSGQVRVVAGATSEPLDINLKPGASVTGTVTDAERQPVTGAEVRVSGERFGIRSSSARSDANGSFRLDGLSPGTIGLSAFLEGKGDASTQIESRGAEQLRWSPVLSRGLELSGRFTDTNDVPLSGWSVMIYPSSGGWAENAAPDLLTRTAKSDEAGRFVLRHLRDVDYKALVRDPIARAFNLDAVPDHVRPGRRELHIRIRAEWMPSAFIVGTVVDAGDQHIGSARVEAWQGILAASALSLTEEGTGRFKIGPVPPGSYGLDIEAAGFAPLRIPTSPVEAGATLDFGTIKLGAPGFLAAKLARDDGRPIEKPELRLLGIKPHAGDPIDFDGEVARAVLAPGQYRLFVYSTEIAGSETAFEIQPGKETKLDIVLRAGVRLVVTLGVPAGRERPKTVHCVLRDKSGTIVRDAETPVFIEGRFYWYPTLAPGTYRLVARTDTGLQLDRVLTVSDGTPPDDRVEFELR